MGNGRYYVGQVNMTKTGIPCQKWDSQKPHSHIQPPNVFPQVQNAENYCRNAGGEEPSPWCYTMNETVRWQLCDIQLCRKCSLLPQRQSSKKIFTHFFPFFQPIHQTQQQRISHQSRWKRFSHRRWFSFWPALDSRQF